MCTLYKGAILQVKWAVWVTIRRDMETLHSKDMSDNSETYVDIVTYRFEWQSGDMGTLLYRDMSDNPEIYVDIE